MTRFAGARRIERELQVARSAHPLVQAINFLSVLIPAVCVARLESIGVMIVVIAVYFYILAFGGRR